MDRSSVLPVALILLIFLIFLSGCVAGGSGVVVETRYVRCPTMPLPALYDLPGAYQDYITPERYKEERAVLEGLHEGFGVEWQIYRGEIEKCPDDDAG